MGTRKCPITMRWSSPVTHKVPVNVKGGEPAAQLKRYAASAGVAARFLIAPMLVGISACQDAHRETEVVAENDVEPNYQIIEPPSPLGHLDQRRDFEYSGQWMPDSGASICEGYLTNRIDEDYCSATVPENWEPFEYNGGTYYVQPLSQASDQAFSRMPHNNTLEQPGDE